MTSVVRCIQSSGALGEGYGFNPRFVTTCYSSLWDFYDYSDSDGIGTGDAPPTDTAVLTFGDTKVQSPTTGQWVDQESEWVGDPIGTVGDVGAVYGLAYSSGQNTDPRNIAKTQRTYIGAYTKRGTRYGDSGPGAIYVRDGASSPRPVPYVTIPSVVKGPTTDATRRMGGADWSGQNSASFGNGDTAASARLTTGGIHKLRDQQGGVDYSGIWGVGRTSLGDLEIDENERFLYAVNLHEKAVYQIDTWSATPQSSVRALKSLIWAADVPEPCTTGGIGGRAAYRPFALAHRGGYLYVGAVCSGEVAKWRSHLRARVDRIAIDASGAEGTWQNVLAEFSLHDFASQRNSGTTRKLDWSPWVEDPTNAACNGMIGGSRYVCPQPMLTSIEFDERGNMLLGFRDRFGDQTGEEPFAASVPAGDILRAPWSGLGWSAPSSSAGGEVYNDYRTMANESTDKVEVAGGALAYVPGSSSGAFGGQVVTTWLDPYSGTSYGAAWFNAKDGGSPTALQLLYSGGTVLRYFGKAQGLGDLELQCAWAALGDRVWNDADFDGVQDAGEGGVNGVRVQLFAKSDATYTTPLATVTTGDVDGDGVGGEYRFYVEPWKEYAARLDPTQFGATGAFPNWIVSLPNQGGSDAADSDANQLYRAITGIAALVDSEQNVSYDFGISPNQGTGQIGDRVWSDTDGDGVQEAGEPGISDVTVDLWACTDLSRLSCPAGLNYAKYRTVTTNASGNYSFLSLPPSFYIIRIDALPTGYVASPANQGGNDALDSDFAAGDPRGNGVLTVLSNSIDTSQDMGLTPRVGDIRPTITGSSSVLLGTVASYTVTAVGGTAPAQNVLLSIALPAGVASVSAPGAAASSATAITWGIGTLAAGTSATRTFDVTYSTLGAKSLTATIASNPVDANTGNNSASVATTVTTSNLAASITNKATLTSIAPGEPFVYQLTVSNLASQRAASVPSAMLVAAQNTAVQVELPEGLTNVAPSVPPTWTVVGDTTSGGVRTIRWNIGMLAASTSQGFSIAVQPRTTGTLPSSLPFSVSVSSSPTTTADATSDNSDTVTTPVRYPDLVVDMSAPGQAGEGSRLAYTVTFRNEGDESALGATLTVTLTDGVLLLPGEVTSGGYILSNGGRTLTWALGALAAGASGATITIPTMVNDESPVFSPLVTAASITSATPERDLSDNADSASTAVIPPPPAPSGTSGGMQLAIHSDLDPKSNNTLAADAVYRSAGTEIAWPAGEVLDFTPRASVALPAMTAEEAQFYAYQARITGWSIVSFGADGKTASASGAAEGDRDALGRSGCRQGTTTRSGLDGCTYSYIGGEDATRPVEQQAMPSEAQMASQAHVYWSAQRPASMRADTYTYRVQGLAATSLTVQVQVQVDVVNRDTGLVLDTRTAVHPQTYTVRLVAPRSVK
jgi:hypothetical protein